MAILAAKTIRGVALGIVLTAIIQSGVAGIGFCDRCTGRIFFGCDYIHPRPGSTAPPFGYGAGGDLVVLERDPVWGTVLLVWTIFVAIIDNIVRPLLIRKGVDLPLLLILTGVIGGLIAFGIIGLFIGRWFSPSPIDCS